MKALCICVLFLVACPAAFAQRFEFPTSPLDDVTLARVLPRLATQVSAVYTEANHDRYLTNLFRLQMVAADYSGASITLKKLRELTLGEGASNSIAVLTPDVIFSSAMAKHVTRGASIEEAIRESFNDLFARLDDKAANDAIHWLWGPVQRLHDDAVKGASQAAATGNIQLADAVELIRNYQLYLEYQTLIPLVDRPIKEDDQRRYAIQDNQLIRAPDGATLCALVVVPKKGVERLPTALNFTIYAGQRAMEKARQAAARGYAGVVANTRGKGCGPDRPWPFVFDGHDANGVIDWISKQPWSDGRVGMYGGSYEGFTQWAAAKTLPPALKTIVPYVANNPGLGLPMENNVFLYANYAYNFYVTDNKYLDAELYNDHARWNTLNKKWYASGRPYRHIDRIDGKANPVLQQQLRHPSYDRYWQSMTPYRDEFAKISIPVLSITGYFEDNLPTLEYFTQHHKYRRNAEHYLVIGPYSHFGAQTAIKPAVVDGYAIDPVAQFDTTELTYQWLDYVLRHGAKPALLQDRVNYEVMGDNLWRHASSLEAMSNAKLILYLTDSHDQNRYRLEPTRPGKSGAIEQTVDFADRTTSNNLYPDARLQDTIDTGGALEFVSDPFPESFSIDGRITADIKAVIDKQDMDLSLAVYEITPQGKYFNLSYYLGRASYADDMSVRKLLHPGRITSIPVRRTPLISRQLAKGSRLLVLLTVNKNAYAQVNYGSGKDVSDESMADAKTPLHVQWQNSSYITVPIWK